jgi:hypothetical protein
VADPRKFVVDAEDRPVCHLHVDVVPVLVFIREILAHADSGSEKYGDEEKEANRIVAWHV